MSIPKLIFVLVSDREIFETKKSRSRRKVENANRIKNYTDISVGDYVVHQTHGIGQYMGTKKMVVGGITKDYLKIQYQGTDLCIFRLTSLICFINMSAIPIKS